MYSIGLLPEQYRRLDGSNHLPVSLQSVQIQCISTDYFARHVPYHHPLKQVQDLLDEHRAAIRQQCCDHALVLSLGWRTSGNKSRWTLKMTREPASDEPLIIQATHLWQVWLVCEHFQGPGWLLQPAGFQAQAQLTIRPRLSLAPRKILTTCTWPNISAQYILQPACMSVVEQASLCRHDMTPRLASIRCNPACSFCQRLGQSVYVLTHQSLCWPIPDNCQICSLRMHWSMPCADLIHAKPGGQQMKAVFVDAYNCRGHAFVCADCETS